MKEPGEGGLAADLLDGQQSGQHHIVAQVSHLGQLGRPGQNSGDEPQGQILRRDGLLTLGTMGQQLGQELSQPVPMEKTGEGQQPGSPADFLVGEADFDGFLSGFELNEFGHCLVTRCVETT